MKITENMLIQDKDGKRSRVVFVSQVSFTVYVIDLDSRKYPYAIRLEEFSRRFDNGDLTTIDNDLYYNFVDEARLSNAERKRREYAWEIVMYALSQVEHEEQIFISKYREKAIKSTISKYDISYSSVRNYLISYFMGGRTVNSLLPKYRLIGGKGKEKDVSGKKRGRPSKYGKQGINVDQKVKKIIKTGLNRYYYNDKQNTLKTAYELTIRDFFTEEAEQDGLSIQVLKSTNILTYNQFRYWYKKFNDPKKEVTKRLGSRVFHQKYRGIIGDSTQDAGLGPGTLWQTDSTPLDVHCVSTVNRNILVGSPLLHMVIDVYSRRIVGFSLSFESLNSYSGAMMALYNSMTSKEDFCRKYGIEIKDDWDVMCIPQRIFTDRGELAGAHIENAIEKLGISIQNAPSYRPETKAIIEQSFHQITQRISPHVDGAIIHGNKMKERGESDNRIKANLTIDEITKILIQCIIFYNNYHVLSDYELDESMVEAGIEKIPREIWEFGVNSKKGQLRTLPEDIIRLHLLPVDYALVTSRGIKYKKMLYASEYSLKNNWFQKARNKSWRIKIWYDPRDLTHLFTLDEEENCIQELYLLEHLSKYKNKGIDEIYKIIEHEQKIDKRSKEKELEEKMRLFNEIEKIVEDGRNKTEAERDQSVSKTRKLKGIRENQRIERDILRTSNTIDEHDEHEYNKKYVESDDELDLFRMLQGNEGSEEG